jgi:heavy metal translocating P-type ATPase
MNRFKVLLIAISAAGLLAGLLAAWASLAIWPRAIWGLSTAAVLGVLLQQIWNTTRRGEFGLDIVAALSMSAAIVLGETLAGAVVALMYASGQLLEDYAQSRARAEMRALLGRAPTTALRYRNGQLALTPIDAIKPGDRILVRQGEIVPVDGRVASGTALLDQAVLTGESIPVRRREGEELLSGSTSLDMAFDMIATRRAADSTYSGIVRLVQAAQEAKAPMVRLADRFALWFLLFTVLLAGGAWLVTGEKLRLLAVLVAATPCPLILAVPVAIVSGISKSARRGVLIKGGPVLETLARASTLVIDKTGTLTHGRARLVDVQPAGRRTADHILRLAASLDQASGHVIAVSIVAAARERGLKLAKPREVRETAGEGIEGHVENHRVAVGGIHYMARKLKGRRIVTPQAAAGAVIAAVAIDGRFAGHLVLADELRDDAAAALARLRLAGISRIVLASGDHRAVVAKIGAALELDSVRGELTPQAKVDIVLEERQRGIVLMAGDGVNDAPALAAADIGISMGARGSPASSEAADAVLLTDDLVRIGEAVEIAKRSRRIALQSVYAGLGLSIAAMAAAAWGFLPPVEGALVQEVIDVTVILNALRALR